MPPGPVNVTIFSGFELSTASLAPPPGSGSTVVAQAILVEGLSLLPAIERILLLSLDDALSSHPILFVPRK
jgi:hypothetical protein